MNITEYLAHPAMSNSKLNWLKRSPLHFKHFIENGAEISKSQEFGCAFHHAVLDPKGFMENYFMLPEGDKRTVFGKLAHKLKLSENNGKIGLPYQDYMTIVKMQRAVHNHLHANGLLVADTQVQVLWNDQRTLVECKAIIDIWKKGRWMADVITTNCADPEEFNMEILKYGYHRKAAFCLDGAGENVPYYFIVVEKRAPFAISIVKLSNTLLEMGRDEYRTLLRTFSFCRLNNCWPGYEIKANFELERITQIYPEPVKLGA